MNQIEEKKCISSMTTIQSCNDILELPNIDEPQMLDFQQDHNRIFTFMNQMKSQKRKYKQLSEEEKDFLQKVIQSVSSFLNTKKLAPLELIYESLVQVAIITSIYQGRVEMLNLTFECIKKIVYFIEEIQEQEQSEQKMEIQSSNCLTYQHKLGAILHMIIILICKTQKQKAVHYVRMLKKLFTHSVRQIIINIQLPKDQKVVKMYAVVLGYIGEKYNTRKIQKKITNKIIELFVLINHDKTLFYLANYLREKCNQDKISSQVLTRVGFIEKLKNMIKQNKEKSHISHLFDLYAKLMAYFPKHAELFYDKQIMFYLVLSKETIQEKNPSIILTLNYNRIITKLLSQFVKIQEIQHIQQVKSWCHQNILLHYEKLTEKSDNQFSLKIISLLLYIVPQNTLLNLIEKNFIQKIFELASLSNDKITLIIMHIAHKIFQKAITVSFWLDKILVLTILQNLSKIDKSTVHYLIVQQVKKLQEFCKFRLIQEQDLLMR